MPLVLSQSSRETARFLKEQGLSPRTYKHAFSASQITGSGAKQILVLPSFYDRRDRHSYLAALRMARRAHPSRRPEILECADGLPAAVDEDRLTLEEALEAAENEGWPSSPPPAEEDPHERELDELFGGM